MVVVAWTEVLLNLMKRRDLIQKMGVVVRGRVVYTHDPRGKLQAMAACAVERCKNASFTLRM